MSSKISTVPYFYIIHHLATGQYYAGAKYGKGANPETFMKPDGYHTSSLRVKELIESDGLDSFKVELIITEFDSSISAHEYETIFLQAWNISKNPKWLNKHNNNGVNDLSKPKSKEHQEKIRLKHLGKIVSEETRAKIRAGNTGKSPSAETRIKLGDAGRGKKRSVEFKQRLSEIHKGKPKSEAHKAKLRKPKSEEHKAKLSQANIGKKASDEVKAKMREDMIGSTFWNDGVKNFCIRSGELPDPTWVRGRLKSK